jgi:hypothetical protein
LFVWVYLCWPAILCGLVAKILVQRSR